jgi:hypothetical protein
MDIEAITLLPPADTAICTSVLPYLKDPSGFLAKLAHRYENAIIECQYDGDGPGFGHIKSDEDMASYLLDYFSVSKAIGKTRIEDRNRDRTIWLCRAPGGLDMQDGK